MDQVNARRKAIKAPPPSITITNFDNVMQFAVKRVYPYAQLQFCIFYVNKN